jgi:hypothetical protein
MKPQPQLEGLSRKIVGYHMDEHSDWVAELECGHRGPSATGSRQPKVGGNILAKSYVARPAIRLTMDSSFLNRLAKVLKRGKSAPCQRAIERLLAAVRTRYEDGQFSSTSEAEAAFRELVNKESVCQK